MRFRYVVVFAINNEVLGVQFFPSLISMSKYFNYSRNETYNIYYNKQRVKGLFRYTKIIKL